MIPNLDRRYAALLLATVVLAGVAGASSYAAFSDTEDTTVSIGAAENFTENSTESPSSTATPAPTSTASPTPTSSPSPT